MKQMFESATIKLTAWYLLILMCISLLFSIVIYQISTTELRNRLGIYTTEIETENGTLKLEPSIRINQLEKANINLFVALFYTNMVILLLGGVISYFAARRTLAPIEVAHEAQSRFTSDASHELRTPLAVMKSELEVALRDKSLSKAEMRELLESNLEEVNRLSDLSQTLLQLSRHDYSALEMKRVNLVELAKSAIKAQKPFRRRIKLDASSKKIQTTGNQSSLAELLIILLDNAIRYSPDDTLIYIRIRQEKEAITLTINNEGPGIPAEALPHVFERFYSGDKSRSNTESFGLGLSLAKKITDLHDATIDIDSQPDKITTVTVVFRKS